MSSVSLARGSKLFFDFLYAVTDLCNASIYGAEIFSLSYEGLGLCFSIQYLILNIALRDSPFMCTRNLFRMCI